MQISITFKLQIATLEAIEKHRACAAVDIDGATVERYTNSSSTSAHGGTTAICRPETCAAPSKALQHCDSTDTANAR